MKRGLFILAFLAGLAAAFALLRSEVSTSLVATRIAGVLVPFGGPTPTFDGQVTVRLFPRLAVQFHNVRIAATHGASLENPDLTADSIIAVIDVLPLLIGETSVSRLILEHPKLRLETTLDLAGLTPDRALLDRLLPASVIVHGGEITLTTPDLSRHEVLTSIDGNLRWPRALGNLSLDGTSVWRGEKVALSLQGIAPPRLALGQVGDFDVTLDAPSFRMSFAGTALLSDHLQLDGVFSAQADDPQRLAELVSIPPPGDATARSEGALPPIMVAGHLRSQGWMGALSDARLRIGQAAADGVLSARLDLPRPQFRGTLALGGVDLTPALTAIREQHWLGWSPDPMVVAGLDVDLRLSIGDAVAGSLRFANLAASLLIADGQVHADVTDVSLLGGTGSLVVRGAADQAGLKAGGRFTLVGASLGALRSAFGLERLPPAAGAVSLIGDFETTGGALDTALGRLRGRLNIEAQRLVLDDPATPVVTFATSRSPLLQAASLKFGLNPQVDQLLCNMTFAASDLRVQRLDFIMGGLKFGFSGQASLASRRLSLSGDARPDPGHETPQTAAPEPATSVSIQISGTLDHPAAAVDGPATDPNAEAPNEPAPALQPTPKV